VDRRRRLATLFNDRYAFERVYVHETRHATYFASEAKALLRVLPELREFDPQGVAEFLAFGCPLDGRTLFRGIRVIEGGSVWTFAGGAPRKRRYFTPAEWERQPALSTEEFQSALERSFQELIPRYFQGRSRLGISLTGGLDSRMIMASLPALETRPICYTFAGMRGDLLDVRVARRVASECGMEHQVLRIGQDFLSDYGEHLDRTVYVTDGCAGALWTHEIYLNAQARELATVRLTGNFGSEVLRSMSTFKPLALHRDLFAPGFRAQVEAVAGSVRFAGEAPVTFTAFREIPWSLFGIVAAAKSQVTFRTPYLDNELVALTYRAPPSVRRSSASALRLVNAANPRLARIPTDRAEVLNGRGLGYALRRFAAEVSFKLDYMHQESPPPGLTGFMSALDKSGFLGGHKWLPYRLWFQRELAPFVTDVLTDRATVQLPFLHASGVRRMVDDHVRGRSNRVREINAALTLAAVDRLLLRGSGTRVNRDRTADPLRYLA
jgi:asparagine synthase (glutamine-hydrolysing)